MPFYEYRCSRCGHHHEELQKVTDRPLKKCPECGRNTLTRLVSAPVFRLKGGGWYETDFKSEKESKRNIAGEKDHPEAAAGPAEKPADVAAKTGEAKEPVAKATAPVKEPTKGKPAARRPSAPKPAAKSGRAARRSR